MSDSAHHKPEPADDPNRLVVTLEPLAAARLEREHSKAEIDFRDEFLELQVRLRKGDIPDDEHGGYVGVVERLLLQYVYHRLMAFAEALMNSGNPPTSIRGATDRYLLHVTAEAFERKHPCARTIDRPQATARFQALMLYAVPVTDAWQEFQRTMIEYADWYYGQCADDAAPGGADRSPRGISEPANTPGADLSDPEAPASAFGRNLDRLRRDRGLSWDQLAHESQVSKKQLLRYVHGSSGAHPKTLRCLANYFGVTVTDLSGDLE